MSDKLMILAMATAEFSKDPSTKVGAVISHGDSVISTGYNHISPRFDQNRELLEDRSWKYPRIIHAEKAAIRNAWTWGHTLNGSVMHVTHQPCDHCALDIIDAGISRIITRPVDPEMLERWPGMKLAQTLFKEAGVSLLFHDFT